MNMIERVARALERADSEGEGLRDFTEEARAAIAAMREPTPEIIETGYTVETFGDGVTDPAKVWPAMIDAALKG